MGRNVDKEPPQAHTLGRVSVGKLHLNGGRGQSVDGQCLVWVTVAGVWVT